jgi:S-adenosylmethionine-diacylglycerol 3-amino-3-carboxypropyl transferase
MAPAHNGGEVMGSQIDYAQCWEDSRLLRAALAIGSGDDVLSIAAAGDNTFALLLDKPRHVIAIDRNPAQLFLVELKIRAIQLLDYDDFIRFVGARQCRDRKRLYALLRSALGASAREFWDRHLAAIHGGIISCGRFERYLQFFRRFVLPLAPGRAAVRAYLQASNVDDQRAIYSQLWNTRRWRLLFRLIFGRAMLGHNGRTRDAFAQVARPDTANVLLDRAHRGLTCLPICDNFFLQFILTGYYTNPGNAHPYLAPRHFKALKARVGEIELVESCLSEYLAAAPSRSISAFNLSDVFEYMPASAVHETLGDLLRVARPGARLAFWSVFVSQETPQELSRRIAPADLASPSPDRGFFYERFYSWRIVQPEQDLAHIAAEPFGISASVRSSGAQHRTTR